MEPIAECHSEVQIFDIFNIPFRALLKIIFVGINLGFKLGNLLFEMSLLCNMALFPNSDGTDQGCCNSLEHDCIDVSFKGEGISGRVGGDRLLRGRVLQLRFWKGEWVRGYKA
jgi:hypothetical protein